jgi:Predicted membrane protein (DUF2157)
MTSISRTEAQQRIDQIRVFNEELARLESAQVLTLDEAQHHAIVQHHDEFVSTYAREFDLDRDQHAKQLSLGMRIASFLGALALAASVFFLFRRFWGLFPESLQAALLVGSSLGTLGTTFLIGRRDTSGYFAKLAAMVAFACFVLNIALLGDMFNITPSDKALLPWSALALLLAYTFDLRLLLGAGLLCLIAFIAARCGTWGGMYWIDFGQHPENFFPAGIILFFVPDLISQQRYGGFAQIYRVLALITVLGAVLVLANWGEGSYLLLRSQTIERMYQVAGFAISGAAIWHGLRRSRTEVVNTGVTFFVIFLYTKFYDWWWDIVPKFVFFLIVALTAILFLLIMRRWRVAGKRLSGAAS